MQEILFDIPFFWHNKLILDKNKQVFINSRHKKKRWRGGRMKTQWPHLSGLNQERKKLYKLVAGCSSIHFAAETLDQG